MPLFLFEPHERSRSGLERLIARLDPHLAGDDDDVRMLVDLVVAELLARIETDQNCPGLISREHDDGRTRPAGKLDFAEVPALHGPDSIRLSDH